MTMMLVMVVMVVINERLRSLFQHSTILGQRYFAEQHDKKQVKKTVIQCCELRNMVGSSALGGGDSWDAYFKRNVSLRHEVWQRFATQ
jgi:hypothetical protein